MNCKFVSVKTGLNSFIPLQHELISLAALSNNYWLYVFNATRFQIFKKFFGHFVLLVHFEILSRHLNIDRLHGIL